MVYSWKGMKKLTFEEVKILFDENKLEGYFKLYPDETEAMIDSNETWKSLSEHFAAGGEVGYEL